MLDHLVAVVRLHEVDDGGVAVALLLMVLGYQRHCVLVVQDQRENVVAVVQVVLKVAVVAEWKL